MTDDDDVDSDVGHATVWLAPVSTRRRIPWHRIPGLRRILLRGWVDVGYTDDAVDEQFTVTHHVHVVATGQADRHVLSPSCPCGPGVEPYIDETDTVANVAAVVYHSVLG